MSADIPLRRRRLAVGLTQLQLAAASGVNPRQIRRVESGASKAENLTLKNAVALAAALGCKPEDLLPAREKEKIKMNMRLDEIIRQLNALNIDADDLEGLGATSLDMALDFRRDMWEGDGACPDPTPEELAALEAECDRNAERLNELDRQRDALIDEYHALTGATPHYYEMSGRYARSRNEMSR